ncbi:1,5-anhydro-D-fructose reductase [Lacunisphaera limnophila]|uniref:1,5-anhydro-D-fructose reductase n=1 Tax=Lacunisphaera limnophila TaxID=1838286 RepID=A0A1D8AWA6_9BACT|nr:Gfo/Idh/MocA family oxidoreductase [Lacunisphaera limnophila]AOS45178.1 1,5-anhydro-D-fructose reductase [Lacunisphaera limnophila]
MPSPLGFAVIGTGMIAGYHAQAIAQTPGAKLVGVVSRSPERGAAFAAQHGIPVITATVEEMVARDDIHVLNITTPSGAHLDPALTAIRAGRHVVIEKPLEITPARCDQIIAAAEQHGVKVAAIFQGRFGAGAQTVKAAVEARRLGRLVLASAYVKWHRTPAYYQTAWKGTWELDGGGALMNQAIHGVDLLQWFAGLPTEVSGRFTRRVHTGIQADDTTVATLQFSDGALGTIEASTALWPGWSRRIELCGEHGSICLEDDHIAQWDFVQPEPGDEAIRAAKRDPALGSGAGTPGGISLTGHLRQIADLVAAVREHRPPAIGAREGRRAVALVHAIYESAKSGQPVKV